MRIANGRVGSDAGVGECTYVGSSGAGLIDYVLVSEELLTNFVTFDVFDPNPISDHCVIEFSLKMKCNDLPKAYRQSESITKVKSSYKWKNCHCNAYIDKLPSDEVCSKFTDVFENLTDASSLQDIDMSLHSFVSIIDDVCGPLFEKSTDFACTNKSTFTYNENCEIKKMIFHDKLNQYRNNRCDATRIEMVRDRSIFKSSVRKFKKECQKQKTNKLIQSRFKDAKEYWRLLKQSQIGRSSNSLSADLFAEYFRAINNPDNQFYQADEDVIEFNRRFLNTETQVMFAELDVEISIQEIDNAIRELNLGRSSGPDKLLNEFIIHGRNVLSTHLCKLFNTLLNKGYFPAMWTEGYIVPIHKKGNVNNVDYYRGITLLSILGKLFTRILNTRLTEWAETYYVYIEAQAGFRAGMGTADNIFVLHGLITHLINQGKKLFCAFVDFKKAFDFINRDIIWYKLIKLGVRGKILNVIRSMYENVKSRVKYNNELSNDFDSYLGVRQGECFRHFYFLCIWMISRMSFSNMG